VIILETYSVTVRGHPFMTSTRRGWRVRLRWTPADRGMGRVSHGLMEKKNFSPISGPTCDKVSL